MAILKYLRKWMTSFSKIMEGLTNSIILLPVYLIGIGTVSLLSKIVGKNFLENKIEPNKNSYWEDIKQNFNNEKENYRQF